jgi:hypothetical protein
MVSQIKKGSGNVAGRNDFCMGVTDHINVLEGLPDHTGTEGRFTYILTQS